MKIINKYICESCEREYNDSDSITTCLGCDQDVCIYDDFCCSSENTKYHHRCYLEYLKFGSSNIN